MTDYHVCIDFGSDNDDVARLVVDFLDMVLPFMVDNVSVSLGIDS